MKILRLANGSIIEKLSLVEMFPCNNNLNKQKEWKKKYFTWLPCLRSNLGKLKNNNNPINIYEEKKCASLIFKLKLTKINIIAMYLNIAQIVCLFF